MSKCIWIFNDYAGSPYHGMEYRNYYISRELVKKGYKVYIVTASYMHLFKKLPNITGEYTFENIDGIEYIWVKVPSYKSSTDIKRVLKWFIFVKKLFSLPIDSMQKPDFIIASPMAPFLILPAYFFAKKYKAKLIYEIKDIWPLSLVELGGYSKWHPFIWFMQRFTNFALKKSELTISVLSNSYEYLKTLGLKKEKYRYIPNGICLEDYKVKKELNHNTRKLIPKDRFIVGDAGTIGIANYLENFVKSAKYLQAYKNILLLIVGDGKNKKNIEDIIKKENLENVLLLEPIPKDEIQSLLQYFDICYIGLQNKKIFEYGVSPNKLYEYLYAKKPVLYAINDKNSIVKLSKSGFQVDSNNPKEIADGIIKLYSLSDEKLKKMSENGYKYVIENHTYKQITEKFIQEIEEI